RPSFFQPLDLHVEPTDLLVEFGLEGLALVVLAATAVGEERLGAVEELLLPLADLDRVDLKGLRQLGKGPGLLGGLQGDPGLEGRGIALAFACHDAPRDGTVNFDQFNIPSGPVFGVHFIEEDIAYRLDLAKWALMAVFGEGPALIEGTITYELESGFGAGLSNRSFKRQNATSGVVYQLDPGRIHRAGELLA